MYPVAVRLAVGPCLPADASLFSFGFITSSRLAPFLVSPSLFSRYSSELLFGLRGKMEELVGSRRSRSLGLVFSSRGTVIFVRVQLAIPIRSQSFWKGAASLKVMTINLENLTDSANEAQYDVM